jgi:hypothetical protein
MKRRTLISAAAAAAAPLGAAGAGRAICELRYFQLRNSRDQQSQRTTDFLKGSWMPAMQRAGGNPAGVFGNVIAPNGPFLLTLTSFASLAAYEATQEKVAADRAYQKELLAADSASGLEYGRVEVTLLRAFSSMPSVEIPPAEAGRPPRIFELRTYESNSPTTLTRKIEMFEKGGEIRIFRRCNLLPVFFAETIVGRNMPNLTYMLAYDDLAARDKGWRAFGSDPEWAKLRSQPGYSDAEIVSNITNAILRPLPFSAIK